MFSRALWVLSECPQNTLRMLSENLKLKMNERMDKKLEFQKSVTAVTALNILIKGQGQVNAWKMLELVHWCLILGKYSAKFWSKWLISNFFPLIRLACSFGVYRHSWSEYLVLKAGLIYSIRKCLKGSNLKKIY